MMFSINKEKILILPEKNLKEFKQTILNLVSEEIQRLVNQIPKDEFANDEIVKNFTNELNLIFRIDEKEIHKLIQTKDLMKINEVLNQTSGKEYSIREKKYGENVWNGVVRFIFLSTIDKYFTEHLTTIEDLREGIGLRGYAQLDPLVEYKNEAFTMFEKLYNDVSFEVIRRIYNVELNKNEDNIKEAEAKFKKEKRDVVFKSAQRIDPFSKKSPEEQKVEGKDLTTSKKNIGRNDPCWCGSGKKYKKCHYP